MNASTFLRPPFSRCPADELTGDPTLDSFLREADRGFAGSWAIRRPYLLELRDHLVASRERRIEAGSAPEQASRAAVEGFGDLGPLAREQRSVRARAFWYVAIVMWVGGGSALVLLLFTIDFPDALLFAAAISGGVALVQGYTLGYLIGTPTARATLGRGSGSEREFLVRHGSLSFSAGVSLLLGSLAVCVLLLAGALGSGPLEGMPAWLALLVLPAAFLIGLSLSVFARIRIDARNLTYGFLGRTTTVPLASVSGVEHESGVRNLTRLPMGQGLRIRWLGRDGTPRDLRLPVDRGMVHTDRMLATLDRFAGRGDASKGKARDAVR